MNVDKSLPFTITTIILRRLSTEVHFMKKITHGKSLSVYPISTSWSQFDKIKQKQKTTAFSREYDSVLFLMYFKMFCTLTEYISLLSCIADAKVVSYCNYD